MRKERKGRTLLKDFFREIRSSLNRYLSILLIVMLGVAFYSGVRSAQPDMKLTADALYDEKNLMDIRVIGTLGLTQDDVEAIAQVEGVTDAQGGYMTYALTSAGGEERVAGIYSMAQNMNGLTLEEGRLPERADECFADEQCLSQTGLSVGDTITLYAEEGDDLSDTLSCETFTIVGAGSYCWYLNFHSGTANIGNGTESFFLMVQPESFSQEAYSMVYVTTDGADDLVCYDEKYKDYVQAVQDRISLLEEERCQARYEEIQQEGQEKIADAKQQISDGEEELEDAEQKLADAASQLEDARQQIEDGEKEIKDGWKQIKEAKAEIREKQQEIEDGWAEIEKAKEQLSQGEEQIAEALAQLSSGQAQVTAGRTELNEKKQQFEAMEAQMQALTDPAAYAQAQTNYQMLSQAQSAGATLSQDQQDALAVYGQVLPGIEAVLGGTTNPDGDALTAAVESVLEPSRTQLSEAESQLTAAEQELAQGKKSLRNAQEKKAQGEAEIAENEQKLRDGQEQLDAAEEEIRANERKLREAEKELEDGKKEYEDAQKEYEDAQTEYDEKSVSARQDIEEAKQKVSDAEQELNDLEVPEWMVLDRESIQSYVEFGQDAERIGAVGKVFPAIFFLVAALVSLTTMTRMVEEQRLQSGTMKALGYSRGAIMGKFVGYALSASVAGSLLGIALGSRLLPYIIISAYKILYVHLTGLVTPVQWGISLSAMVLAVACTVLATYAASFAVLRATPAELMRPVAPAKGKRVLLERVTFLWKRLPFSHKATLRNLFRYKKRFLMTVLGIGACTGLILVAFGLRESISEIVNRQYSAVWTYDVSITLENTGAESAQAVCEELENVQGVTESLTVRQCSMDAEANGTTKSVYLFVPEKTENLEEFVLLHSRTTGSTYTLDDRSVIITEKLARLLDVQAGDEITLKQEETDRKTVTVAGVAENYLYHYVYMTPTLYEELFEEEPDYDTVCLRTEEGVSEDDLGRRLLNLDGVSGVSFVSDLEKKVADMVQSLNMVVWVLVISAGLLAFIVLYNLNNISIIERRRELATLKVLGFHDEEVAAYVYRENVWLTCIGIVAGLGIGRVLHRFVIQTCEVDLIMFGQSLGISSYACAVALTFVFAAIVNFMMFFTLRRIDMVESMKSVE